MENNNFEITPLNWVLSILGIIFLTCLIVLPPVFRVVFKEKEEVIDTNELVVENMTCTKNLYAVENHMEQDTIEFTYVSNRINKYSRVKTMTFNDFQTYEQYKQEYGKLSSAYSLAKKGVEYVLKISDGDLKITVNEKFNLGLFQNTQVTIPGDSKPTSVTSEFTRNDLITTIKSDLKELGYKCVNSDNK